MKRIFRRAVLLTVVGIGTGLFPVQADSAPVKSGYAPVRGLKIYYELYGATDPKKIPLVLLHGGGSTIGTSFGTVIEAFAQNRPVIAFEQRGHGHTADTDKPFSFEDSADDAAALLKYLKVKRADFFGYSNGGSIAMQVAIRHPGLANKLVVASAMTKRDGLMPGFWDSMKTANLNSMPADLKDAYVRSSPHPEKLQSFHDKSVQRMLDFKDWPDTALKSIQAPTLILVGDADIIKPEHAVEMYRMLPHSNLLVLPNADHMTLVHNWPVELIERFLDAPLPGKP